MGSTIKGIIVSIGGDTTKLDKALKGVDRTSQNLQIELNLINKELKFNPDSAVLLAQKQDVLKDKVDATREKLQKLNEVQEQVERQAKSGDLGADEYRAYQREVEKTKSQLEYLEKELENTNDKFDKVQRKSGAITFKNAEDKVDHFKGKVKDMADNALENAEKLSKGFEKVGDGLEKAGGVINKASAAGAAVLAGSVAAYKDLDNGYDIIVKKTGAVDEKFDSLKKTADELFGSSTFDMTAIGNAIGEVNTRFGFTDEKLKSISESYLQFAKINDADVSASVEKTARIMQAWNISSDNIPDLLGMITAEGQKTGVAVDALMDKVLDNNSTFKEMGLSLEESIALMAQFEQNGVNDSTALAALKAAVKNSAKEGQSLSDVLQRNVKDIQNAKSDTEALQIATSLFGAKGAAEMANAIKEGRINFDDLSGSMSDYKDTVKKTYEGTLDPLEESKKGLNNLKLAGAELANVALKEGEPLIDDVIDGIKGITEGIKKLTPEQKKTLAKTIEIVAVAGPAVKITGGIAKGISSIASVASSLIPKLIGATGAQEGLNVAMDSNPVGAVVLGITALVAALGGLCLAADEANKKHLEDLGFTEQTQRMKESLDKVDEIKERVNGLKDDINKTLGDTSANLGVVDDYKDRLDELLNKADWDSADKAELKTIGEYFSEKYPEFKGAWDEYIKYNDDGTFTIDENIKKIAGTLDTIIDKYKKVAASQALSNLSTKSMEDYIQSKQDVNKAALEYTSSLKNFEEFKKEWGLDDNKKLQEYLDLYNYDRSGAIIAKVFSKSGEELNVENLIEHYQEMEKSLKSVKGSYDEVLDSTAQLKMHGDELNRMQAAINGNYDDASAVLMAYNNNLISSTDIEKSKWGSLDNLKNKAKETADETGQKEEIIKQLLSEGLEYANKHLEASEKAAEDTVKISKSELEKLPFVVEDSMNKSTKMIDNKKPELKSAMGDSASLGVKEFSIKVNEGIPKAEKDGKNFVLGFINGLMDKTGLSKIWNATKSIASTALEGIKKFLGINSPSKEAEKLGDYFGIGFIDGIEKNRKGAINAAKMLSDSAQIGLSLDGIKNTYANIAKLKSSGIAETRSRISNINNSTSKNFNGGINVTINQAKLDTDADVERMGEKLADIIIRKGMEWG